MLLPPVLKKEQLLPLTPALKGKDGWPESCMHIHMGSMRKGKRWQDPCYKHIWAQRTDIHYLRNGSLMLSFESGTNI